MKVARSEYSPCLCCLVWTDNFRCEAAATGLPVVAGDSGGAGDTVRHGETG
jgi:glycosyltransferase involved in cell wall biosynthesis